MEKAIVVKNVTKKYKLYENAKERILDLIRPNKYGESFYALSDVDFEAEAGEVIGFIGTNGSGKSTLSNIIAGIVPETSGSITVNGEVALIAVAAGLKNDLSGRENIELKLLMLGLNKKEIEELEPNIIEFAELEQFIDQPVKSYSSGMKSRLGFAISVNVDPDILIIDEALSVGDKAFAEKSLNKMKEFKAEGKTMIFVSHSIGQMKKFCDKILWLEFGRVKEYGSVKVVIPKYEDFLEGWKKLNKKEREQYKEKIINNEDKKASLLIEKKKEIKKADFYKEIETSLVARLKKGDSYIYESPKDLTKHISSKKYQGYVYYIKKRVDYNGARYFLISEEPSAQCGVIGWMKREDLYIVQYRVNDTDQKTYTLKGIGRGFDQPWGDSGNVVIESLKAYKGVEFHVKRTDKAGKVFWYYGDLDGKKVWIYGKNVIV